MLGGTVWLAGCTTSQLRATDNVTLRGRVVGPDGTGIGGLTVLVRKALSADELKGRMQPLLSSVQLACVADHPPGACHRAHYEHTAATDSGGAFSVALRGSDTQTALGLVASVLQVAARTPASSGELSGGLASEALRVQTTDVSTAPVNLWSAHVVVSAGTRLAWPALAVHVAPSPSYRVVFDDGSDGLVWDSGPLAARTTYDIDPRLLEDVDGAVSIVATSDSLAFRSPRLHLVGTAGPPMSRGRPCDVGGTPSISPCPLTDGRFDSPGLRSLTGAATRSAVVDLGRRVLPTLIVIRGCATTCPVDVSEDRQVWARWGTASGGNAALPPPASPPAARFVRVAAAAPELAGLTEVSVWDGAAALAPPVVRLAPGTPATVHAHRALGLPLEVAAVVALVLAAAAAGIAVGRRRSPAH
ncbi:MAG: hypothetical protein ACYDH6_12275 [Acidimicrobiales bacterium]